MFILPTSWFVFKLFYSIDAPHLIKPIPHSNIKVISYVSQFLHFAYNRQLVVRVGYRKKFRRGSYMVREGLSDGGRDWDAAALGAAGWSGVLSGSEHSCPAQRRKKGTWERAPLRSRWNCRGSALPCDLKAFQGSAQLQGGSWAGLGGQMVEEGETWVVGAREHEN